MATKNFKVKNGIDIGDKTDVINVSGTGTVFDSIKIEGSTITSTDSSAISFGGDILSGIGTPSGASDATTKAYVDSQLAGLSQNSITQGDSNVTVTDGGTGAVTIDVDGSTVVNTVAAGVTVTGTLTSTGVGSFATGTTVGNITLANGSITDSSGTIDFGDEDLDTTGDITAAGGTLGNVQLGLTTDNTIDTSSGNLTISPTGGATTVTGTLSVTGDFDADVIKVNTLSSDDSTQVVIEDGVVVKGDNSTISDISFSFTGSQHIISTQSHDLAINAATNSVFITATTLDCTGDLIVEGNLTVEGTETIVNTTTLEVEDNKIIVANGNSADAVDFGFFGHFYSEDSTAPNHSGFFRDATNSEWYLMATYSPEPIGNTIDRNGDSFSLASMNVAGITATGVTAGNILVGVTGDNEIDTSSGNLTIDSAGGTVTVDDNLTVSGNLTVNGTTTTVSTTNMVISDSLIALSTGTTGAPANDSGFIVERGDSANVGFIWDESADQFACINTTEVGTTAGNVTISSYANLQVNTLTGTATQAQYADLAEKYEADADYEPGTVVHFGGDKEVTLCDQDMCTKVAGVISTNPAHTMNSNLTADHVATVALVGRVPVKVTGAVAKGDMLVSAGNGMARAEANPSMGSVIGKALQSNDSNEPTVIEVVVGRL